MTTKLLLDERPLIVQPSLVKLLGSIERAVVLQQIHWLLQQPHAGEIDEDGNKWVWGTLQQWCDDYFPMWQPPALKKHIRWLREQGYLIVEQRSPNTWDKTNYYRIDYQFLTEQAAKLLGNDRASSKGNDRASSKGNDRASSKGNDRASSKGNDRASSKGNDRYPSNGNDRYPSLNVTETSTETSNRDFYRESGARARARPTDDDPSLQTQSKNPQTQSKDGARLPDDWTPPDDWIAWAMEHTGWGRERVLDVADRFRDYWISVPGAKGRKRDWLATWRNWVRRELDDSRNRAPPTVGCRPAVGNQAAIEESIRQFRASRRIIDIG